MAANKHIGKIIIALMAAAVVLCFLAVAFSGKLTELLGGTGVSVEYESKLFDTDEIISVEIEMDEDDWSEMLSNALSEEYYVCNVVINGKRVNNVAIRPKGNTSLSSIAMNPDTDRYSLKLEFDHYVDGQTCYGLDKLILNNNYADATNMKEAIIYDMFQFIGADASLYNFAKVSVNGEYWGVYLALEGVEDSFALRNFGTQDGELYKPDTMEMGGGDRSSSSTGGPGGGQGGPGGFPGGSGGGEGSPDLEGMTPPSGDFPGGDFDPSSMEGFDPSSMQDFDRADMPDMGDSEQKGGPGMGSNGGANLNYTDDDLDSYSVIFNSSLTGSNMADQRRVVTALKNISEGTDLEKYLDIDNILKYMAVHVFSVNEDSLSGNMSHNYYLYEYDGRLNLFPWDYNLCLGGMSMGKDADATEVVNDAIDTPFSGTEFFDSLLTDEEYLAQYHAYLQQLVDEYVGSGRFEETYNRIRSQIDELVETDPTAFYSYEEYCTAAELLYETITLRAESIDGQLSGTIPSTDDGQREDSSTLIDASHIDVTAMGQFNMGGFSDRSEDGEENNEDRSSRRSFGGRPGGRSRRSPNGLTDTESSDSSDGENGDFPEGFDPGNMPNGMPGQSTFSGSQLKNLITFGICLVIMLAGVLIVWRYKRRR